MILPLIFLGFGLIHGSSTGVEALEFTLLSNPVAFDTAAKFHWDAIVTDPDSFSVEVGQDGVTLVPFSDVVARGGALQGSIVTPPLETPGPYKFRAKNSNGQTFAEIDFPVSESSTAVETTSKQSSTSSLITSHSTDITQGSGTSNTAKFVLTSSDPLQDSVTGADNSHRTLSPSTGFLEITHEATAVTNSFTSSTISSQPSVLSTASSVVSPHRNTTPIIAGSVSAVILIIALIIGGLFISRRRQRLRNIAEFPYETSMSDIAGPTRFVPRGLSENGLSGPQLASEKQASPEQVVPGGEPTERQRFLQARAEEINRQLTESENALTNVADAPPDLMTTLMAENIRQNAEIQRLRDLISSDWALGLTDNPPPYYPYSEAATE